MYREQSLNDDWYVKPGFEEAFLDALHDDGTWEKATLPHTPVLFIPQYRKEGSHCTRTTYQRHIILDDLADGETVFVRFEGIATSAVFYVDKRWIAESEGAYLPCTIALGCRQSCTLTVVVDASENPSFPPYGGSMDYLSFSGIYRTATMIMTPIQHLTFLGVESQERTAVLVKGRAEQADNQILECRLYDQETLLATKSVPVIDGEFSLRFEQLSLQQWSCTNPYLYQMQVCLGSYDQRILRFGSRDARFTKDGFFLNNEKLTLVGMNRHQDYPYLGYSAPPSLQWEDARKLRELGLNMVRCSHYPPDPSFLDACDALGLLVFEELPGWQHIGMQEHWRASCLDNVRSMIERDYNHPSLILWGVRINESADDEDLYRQTNALAKVLDPMRATGGVRNLKKSQFLEDVYTYNDFSNQGKGRALAKKCTVCSTKVPYLVTEYGGHMFPAKRFDPPTVRVEHAVRHYQVLDALHAEEGLCGGIGWCFHDYFTHANFGSGDQICYHGICDLNRVEKGAAYVYKTQQDEPKQLVVLSSMDGGDHAKAALPSACIATNCEAVRLLYNGHLVGTFHPDRKSFPHLAHPPVFIDDFIGERLQEEDYLGPQQRKALARLLGKVGRQGGILRFGDLLKMAWFLKLHHKTYQDAVSLFNRYVGNWGSEGADWTFEGLENGVVVVSQSYVQGEKAYLSLNTRQTTLLLDGPTYSMAAITVEILRRGQVLSLPYATIPFTTKVEGVLALSSPSINTTQGGTAVIYVRTKGEKGSARVTVSSVLGDKHLDFTVR